MHNAASDLPSSKGDLFILREQGRFPAVPHVAEGINKLRDAAHKQYSVIVDQVLTDQITDEHRLEQIMDGLCDFCDEERFIELYRSLCRHIYYQYPQLVGEYVAMFRTLFEGNENGNELGKE